MAQDSVVLKKDDKTPFNGILLPPEMAQDYKNTVIERDGFKKSNESLQKSLNLQLDINDRKDNIINTVVDQNNNLAKNLNSERSLSDVSKLLIFGTGVLATVLVLYGVKKAQ